MLTFLFLEMRPLKAINGLYVITGPSKLSEVEFATKVLEAGARIIQLREKDKNRAVRIGRELRALTQKKGALLIINDFPEIAKTVDADGVHLGQEDMPLRDARMLLGQNKLIGKSTHSLEQALEAEREGADYVGIGPIYQTRTKDYEPIGTEAIEELQGKISIPFVAIGGINEKNIDTVIVAGARCVAMASALLEAENLKEKVKFFTEKIGGN